MNKVKYQPRSSQAMLCALFLAPLIASAQTPLSLGSFFVPKNQNNPSLTFTSYTFSGASATAINYIELCKATDTTCSNCTANFKIIDTGTPVAYTGDGTPRTVNATSIAAYLTDQGLLAGSYNIGFYVRASGTNCSSSIGNKNCSANSDTTSHLLCMQADFDGVDVTSVTQTDNGMVQLNTPTFTPTVLAGGAGVANTGATGITGDVHVSSLTGTVSGSPTINGTTHLNDSTAANAKTNAINAYNAAVGLTCPPANNLTGEVLGTSVTSLPPGVYCFPATTAQITGTLTLAGTSSTDSYTFQVGTTLTTAAGANIILQGGVTNDNVTWALGSAATLGATNSFAGIINAQTAITVGAGSIIRGRLWAQEGSVTLDSNQINPN